MEREWLIEEFVSDEAWKNNLAWMVETLDRFIGYYSRGYYSTQPNRNKNIEVLKKMKQHVAFGSYYRPWVPTYLFSPFDLSQKLTENYCYGVVDYVELDNNG